MMIKIEIDPAAGFCFGVDRVIEEAESMLLAGESLYGLGEMVHNQAEVERLHQLGLRTIQHSDLPTMGSRKVLFRAHGEPPSTYRLAMKHGVEVIDGTCPIVSRLQERIRNVYEGMDHEKEQLVIFGKPEHPETIGLVGQVSGDAVVVTGMADIEKIVPDKKVYLFSQTTMDPDRFRELERAIEHRIGESVKKQKEPFRSECTICGQMRKRKPRLSEFAKQFDLILFVSGKNSSNGRMLFEFCREVNPSTHWISSPADIDPRWLEGMQSVGISGATSTSLAQLEATREQVSRMIDS